MTTDSRVRCVVLAVGSADSPETSTECPPRGGSHPVGLNPLQPPHRALPPPPLQRGGLRPHSPPGPLPPSSTPTPTGPGGLRPHSPPRPLSPHHCSNVGSGHSHHPGRCLTPPHPTLLDQVGSGHTHHLGRWSRPHLGLTKEGLGPLRMHLRRTSLPLLPTHSLL